LNAVREWEFQVRPSKIFSGLLCFGLAAVAAPRTSYWKDDLPQLSTAQMAQFKNATEWWYFDAETPNGSSVVLIIAKKNPLISQSRSLVQIEFKQGPASFKKVVTFDPKLFFSEMGPRSARWGANPNNRIEMSFDPDTGQPLGYRVAVEVSGFKANLNFRPLHAGFLPTPDGCYFFHKASAEKKSCVNFAAPKMTVDGEITYKKQSFRIENGEGYHDHPWATDHFIHTHRNWHWARLYSPKISVMYADVKPQPAYAGQLKFIYSVRPEAFAPKISDDLSIAGNTFARESSRFKGAVAFPHAIEVKDSTLFIQTRFLETLSDIPMYNRSLVDFEIRDERGEVARGQGWTEYVNITKSFHSLLASMSRLQFLFWRL
jgi:hypothetical protein